MVKQIELKISDIKLLDNNPRKIDEAELKKLCDDIEADPSFLIQRSPLVNLVDGVYYCYAGTQRVKACTLLGRQTIICFVEENVSKEVQDKRMILDNTHRGEWDVDLLMSDFNFTIEELKDMGIETEQFNRLFDDDGNGAEKEEARKSLQDRFIVPPFSILDTRQGYWQDRKKTWHKLGINSQETREGIEIIAQSGQSTHIYELRNKMRDKLGREPEWPEIIEQAKAMGLHLYEGASIFDPVLTEICYRWFCPEGGTILDPFAGGSVRGVVASVLGYNYHGIDLRHEQVDANRKQAELMNQSGATWYTGDSSNMEELLDKDLQADFIFSCPPYHDLEKYSEDPADLSNMDYHDFCRVYRDIITKAMAKLKPNRFACFVVGDIRDKAGAYRNFVSETIDCFTKCIDGNGHHVKYYNEVVLINVAGSLAIRVGRQFSAGRKVGKTHQNVLVFYKGDPKAIKKEFPEVELPDLTETE